MTRRHGWATIRAAGPLQDQSTPPLPDPSILRSALTRVIDPEVGMNIVDLGLIYDIRVAAERIEVDLTMTTPSCPMSSLIADQVRDVIMAAGVTPGTEVAVNLVWEPPWEPTMMSDTARRHFGWG